MESKPSTVMPPNDAAPKSQPDASQLEDRLPEWFRTTPRGTALVALLGLLFTFFSLRPLWHTDLWGHLAYGRVIAESGSIPDLEPFMPLAQGVELVDTWWLSQRAGYAVYEQFGVTGLQCLYAAAITFCLALLARRLYARTESLAFVVAGLAAFLWVEWQAVMVIRPQLAGLCCFTALFVWTTRRRASAADWFLVPLLMIAWVNLHGSFLLGPLLLGTLCCGRGFDLWRRTGSWRRAIKDRRVLRLLLLTELAAAAIAINPYGIDIYAAPFALLSNANIADLVEWEPLTLRMKQGQAAFAVALVLIVAMPFSPRRVTTAEALLLCGLGGAALWSSRMLVWWGPVAATSLVAHSHAIYRQWKRLAAHPAPGAMATALGGHVSTPRNPHARPARRCGHGTRRSLWTLASIGLVWIFFGFSPFGMKLIHGIEPEFRDAVSRATPIGAAEYLGEHPPRGLVFNWDQWGDYLVWKRPGQRFFITTHAHLVPRQVWNDYRDIAAGWTKGLDRYGVNTVVISPVWQFELWGELQSSPDWELVFADDRSAIFRRKQPIGIELRH